MILYHYTDKDNLKEISPSYFGKHYFTDNDSKLSNIKRCFYYTKPKPEALLKSSNYLYLCSINSNCIYNLIDDKLSLINRSLYPDTDTINFNQLFKNIIAKGFIGVYYTIGNYGIVIMFESLKPEGIINLRRL